jgi:two-component system, cell cycle response regulator
VSADSTVPPGDLQRRVLVVDDSRFVRTTFAHILKSSFAVSEAIDGEQAWTTINADPSIVMVFTDLDMPKLNGFGLLDRMRKSDDPRIKALPVVVISGNEEPTSKQRAKDLGANDFIAKSADAPEVLARLDNVLRLVKASRELEQTRAAAQSTATHDPLTGAHTPHYLVTEGRKHFAHARRHSGDLSVMALRLDTYEAIVMAASKDIADIVVARVAKLVMEKVRAEDSVARVAQATFVVLATTAGSHMSALAERLRRELDEAKVTYREQPLKFVTSVGVASISADPSNSIEELIKLSMQRLQAQPRTAPVAAAPGIPDDLERVLRYLEALDISRLGSAADAFAKRLKKVAKAIQNRSQ